MPRPGRPRPRSWSARHAVAWLLCRAATISVRTLRLGSGTTIGGRLAMGVDPGLLRRAAARRQLTVISGTNGKTTTRVLTVAALSTRHSVVSNSGGANLPSGWATTLLRHRRVATVVLEVDEAHLGTALEQATPSTAVLLNLSRDQLDRYAETHHLAALWRAALTGCPGHLTVLANSDDPLVAWAAMAAPDVQWISLGARWLRDAATCPECGAALHHRDEGRRWWCDCGLRRPLPHWLLRGELLRAPDGRDYPLRTALPGQVNVANAAAAVAAAACAGVPIQASTAAIERVSAVEGRYREQLYRGRWIRLLLAKNPAGWQEALDMLRPPPAPVVLATNARTADGRDPAWLWDVDFERLRGRTVVATGERSRDLAVRLRYADVSHLRVDDPAAALLRAPGEGAVQAVANYTAFTRLRRLVGAA